MASERVLYEVQYCIDDGEPVTAYACPPSGLIGEAERMVVDNVKRETRFGIGTVCVSSVKLMPGRVWV